MMKTPLLLVVAITAFLLGAFSTSQAADERPNILWIIADDMSAHFSCYGEKTIQTPHVDALAERGSLFSNAYVTAPVCSTNRSAFVTGMYQTSIGAHQHRSGRGELKIQLPDGIRLVPELFQEAGYYTAIAQWPLNGKLGKTDYNFEWDPAAYDSADWAGRKKDQPFFAQIQIKGGKLRGAARDTTEKFVERMEPIHGPRTAMADVVLPPYYPYTEDIIFDWAAYLDSVRETDRVVGDIVQTLADRGELENTVVLFMTDHGISHARGKQYCYDEGLHVPLVIAGPGVPTETRHDLVEHIDIAALSLGLAGIAIPDYMQARDILADDYTARDYVFAARDRCDETVERIRSVRSDRFKYIRNYYPERPHLSPNNYKDNKLIYQSLRAAHQAGELTEQQEEVLFAPTRQPEELYDLDADPWEMTNLAGDPTYQQALLTLRQRLDTWIEETGDQGDESEEMWASDMAAYLKGFDRKGKANPDGKANVQRNIEQMKAWKKAGK